MINTTMEPPSRDSCNVTPVAPTISEVKGMRWDEIAVYRGTRLENKYFYTVDAWI